jgi:hypothetical protein
MIIKDILISKTDYTSGFTNLTEVSGQALIMYTKASGTLTRTGWSSQSLPSGAMFGILDYPGNTLSYTGNCTVWRLRRNSVLHGDSSISANSTLYVGNPPFNFQNRHLIFIRTNSGTASNTNLVISFYDQANGNYGIERRPLFFDGITGHMQVNNYKFYIKNVSTGTSYYVFFNNYPLRITSFDIPDTNLYFKIIKEYETL